jgi:PhzF family phenazine biosynthesis protein
MEIPIYQVDAFTSRTFSGNPAAVCPLGKWLPDHLMQAIALENNLSETAFFLLEGDMYRIRWFTPETEVDLCGHATLASAHVIFHFLDKTANSVRFNSRSGVLEVSREGDLLAMNFPAQPPIPCDIPRGLISGLGKEPILVMCSEDFFVVYDSEDDVRELKPDMHSLCTIGMRGVIVTAQGKDTDFVSRFFAPRVGIPEDPVTGSAHCALIPYWSQRLGRTKLHARQLSKRGGDIFCKDLGERVEISGHAALFMRGTIMLDG